MIIGVTGPLCAGTDTFGDILRKEKGFEWMSYSDVLREEARKMGIEITRKNLQDLGDAIRKEFGDGILSEKLIEKMKSDKDYVVGNIRNPGEVEALRRWFGKKFVFVRVDAPLEIRFERLLKRRREQDPENFEDFKKVEERDMGNYEKHYGQHHASVFTMADFSVNNDGSYEEFREKVLKLFEKISVQ
jgi:dephospho-CoA kinase